MLTEHIDNFTRGWLIGDFSPAIHKADCELQVRFRTEGDHEPAHRHLKAREINIVADGVHIFTVDGVTETLGEGQIIIIEPGEACEYLCVEPGVLVCWKSASIPGDKHPV